MAYANASYTVAFIERLSLWVGPAMAIYILIAVIVMVIKLANNMFRSSKYELITDSNQLWKALKQLLPCIVRFPEQCYFFIIEILTGVHISCLYNPTFNTK